MSAELLEGERRALNTARLPRLRQQWDLAMLTPCFSDIWQKVANARGEEKHDPCINPTHVLKCYGTCGAPSYSPCAGTLPQPRFKESVTCMMTPRSDRPRVDDTITPLVSTPPSFDILGNAVL